jgi:hypothetical protein
MVTMHLSIGSHRPCRQIAGMFDRMGNERAWRLGTPARLQRGCSRLPDRGGGWINGQGAAC